MRAAERRLRLVTTAPLIDERVPACAVVQAPAALVAGKVEGLLEAVTGRRNESWRSVVLDLARVEAMSSLGVRCVVQLAEWCRREGLWFALRAPSSEARRVCALTGLLSWCEQEAPEDAGRVELEMNAEREVVGAKLDAIEAALAGQGQPRATVLRARLALEELLLNIVDHGKPRSGRIQIRLQQAGAMLRVRIVDDGAPFDPFRAELETHSDDIAERRIGGLGLLLMRQSCDWARYERRGDANVVEVGFLPARSGSPTSESTHPC